MKKQFNFSTFAKIIPYLRYVPPIILRIKNWPDFILSYVGLKDGEFECIFRDGTKIAMQDNIGVVTTAVVFIKNDYGEVKDNSVVIDIGANIGVYSIFAANGKNVRVFAFEPMPDNFKMIQKNIELNNLQGKIIPYNLAVSGKTEKRKLYLGGSPFHSLYSVEDSPFNALHDQESEATQNVIEVDCLPLDSVFLENKIERCDILKMDCEGAEFEILYNLKDKHFNAIKEIRMEYHNHKEGGAYTAPKLVRFLEEKGFEVKKNKKSSPFQGDLWLENTRFK